MDDLILSSIALYESTNNKIYLEDALGFYQSKDWRTNHTEPLSWDNKATILFYVESLLLTLFLKYGAVYIFLAQVLFDVSNPDPSLQRRIEAENYLDGIVNKRTVNQTGGGLLFWDHYRY